MKQKVVIKLSMKGNDKKSRSKAFKIAVSQPGVEKVAMEGEEKNELMVIGEGIDAAELATTLRKKVGFANVMSVGPVEEKKEEKPIAPFFYGNYQMPPLQYWEVRDPYYYSVW